MEIPSFPAYPTNGGRMEAAPKKIGEWVYQSKIDDWHGIVHVPTSLIWNQDGKPSSIAEKFVAALAILKSKRFAFEWLDVGLMNNRHDMMRGCILVFDYIPTAGCNHPFSERRKLLELHFEILPFATELLNCGGGRVMEPVHDRVFLINQLAPRSDQEVLALYKLLQAQNRIIGKKFYEGLVAKRIDKPYPLQLRKPKEPTPWMMKHRFDQ